MIGSQYTWSAINVYYASYLKYHDSPNISITDVYFLMPSILFIQYIFIFLGVKLEKAFNARIPAIISPLMIVSSQVCLFLTTKFYIVIIVMVIAGIGNGIGFLSVVNNGWRYYPNKKGLVNGIILGGLGLSSAILNPIADFVFINPNKEKVQRDGFYSQKVADNLKSYFIFTILLFGVLSVLGMSLTFPYKEEPTIENVHGFIEEEKNSEIIPDIKQKIIESDDEFKQALFSKENAMLCIICFGAPCNIYIYNTI